MKRFLSAVTALVLMLGCLGLVACKSFTSGTSGDGDDVQTSTTKSEGQTEAEEVDFADQLSAPKKGDQVVVIHTSMGDISIKMLPQAAPKAVENFVTHAQEGYYDNVIFHRVINDFMIQGGDPLGTGYGGESIWGDVFENDCKVGYCNYRGALAMANSGADTNGSQFFINQCKKVDESVLEQMTAYPDVFTEEVINNYAEVGGNPHLDMGYTVFGQVYEGMDVVDAIAAVEVDSNDKPLEDVVIKSIDVLTYGE